MVQTVLVLLYTNVHIQNPSFHVPLSSLSSASSFNSQCIVLDDRQELYHSKSQWHSKASIFTTYKHQWPNLKDWLIPLLTWLAAGGCAYERHLFNSARCRGERVMSFKLPCQASPCLSFATFQVQAYFEEEAQSHKCSGQVLGTLCQARTRGYESGTCRFPPPPPPQPLILFYEGNLLLFFLNPIRAEWANIRSRGIKVSLKEVTGLLFNSEFLPSFILSTWVS